MRKFIKLSDFKIIKFFGLLFMVAFLLQDLPTYAEIPAEYRANPTIQPHIDKVGELFLKIDANKQLGEEIKPSTFVDIYKTINALTPYLPQDYKFKLVYEKCGTLSKKMSMGFDVNTFNLFMESCHSPLTNILNMIKSKYTISPSASVNPQSGSAPLVVTFDARNSVDPSNETIPGDNYFWYYRDIKGEDKIIGRGAVVKYKFKEAGTYKVHLTVRSSNHINRGIFDGKMTLTVVVTPKSAQINISANNRKLNKNTKEKFGTQEGQKGIIFDASSTIPMGGREILSHTWEITGPGVSFSKSLEGSPSFVKIPLQENGEYSVVLNTVDNEGNTVSEKYNVIITDPVAVIATTLGKGDTSTMFSFGANNSYSVVSSLKLFTWEIFDENGEKIDTLQTKNIEKKFNKPGNYTIKLTVEDALGRINIATQQIFVESTPPVAQFSSKSISQWLNPSEFFLDASLSHDIDMDDGIDELSYERKASDPQNTIIDKQGEKQANVQFNTVGKHFVTLIVRDKYGKSNSITKEFTINSILRPKIKTSARAITWGEYINFVVMSNDDILSYQWEFGDGEERYVQTNIIKHKYEKVGTYRVKLKVFGKDNMENEVYETIFVGDKNSPIPSYNIYSAVRSEMLYPKDICIEKKGGETIEHQAYQVDRYQDFYINASETINSRGMKQELKYFYKLKDENIFVSSSKFNYKFKKIGCKYIDLTVEDSQLGKTVTERIWFKVYNSMPTLDNVELFFPQYGNQMGVGFNQNTVTDIFNSSFDPLKVKVTAVNPVDSDGYISYYKRYYYRKDDPTTHIELKITPSSLPYAYFSLPRVPGEYMFGVTLYDNNEGKTRSEDVIGNGPMIVFPPAGGTPDVPIVTLKSNLKEVKVGEEVQFDVFSKIISDKPDFDATRVIRYDFDGDGKWDLTTKKDQVIYVYKEEGQYNPLVEVSYRGYYTETGLGANESITVKKGIKPVLLFDHYKELAIFRTQNIGNIIETNICFDVVDCKNNKTSDAGKRKTKEKYFSYEYPGTGRYYAYMQIKDDYANIVDKTREVNIQENTLKFSTGAVGGANNTGTTIGTGRIGVEKPNPEYIHILSVPKTQLTSKGNYEAFVGKNLANSILYYVKYKGDGECYIDLDVTDNIKKDFVCNELYFHKYIPSYKTLHGKIYYTVGEEKKVKNLKVGFIDYALQLDSKMIATLEKLNQIIDSIEETTPERKILKQMLVQIQDDIVNESKTQDNLLTINEYVENMREGSLSSQEQKSIKDIIDLLSNEGTKQALGTNEYQQAKAEILSITPELWKQEIEIKFARLENVEGGGAEKIYRKKKIEEIGKFLQSKRAKSVETQTKDQILDTDMQQFVKPNLCRIANYYNIETTSCKKTEDLNMSKGETKDESLSQEKKTEDSGGMPRWLKIILIILGIVVGGFLVMIIVFAIKARMTTDEEE